MVKRNVFLTYHHADQAEVEEFVTSFRSSFNEMRVLSVSDDDAIDSNDTDYVLRTIREKYITGTSATIALIGSCTWARKYVDWELAATLRNNPTDPRGGLLAVQLPSVDGTSVQLPSRVAMNHNHDKASRQEYGYAAYYRHPSSGAALAQWVESAITRRHNRDPAPGSTTDLKTNNSPC